MKEDTDERIQTIRGFNRFYTKQIGLLQSSYLKSPFSLAEVRVLYELAHNQNSTATDLGKELDIDAGYLSRILLGFEKNGLITRTPSETDARQSLLSLTKKGLKEFAPLNKGADKQIRDLLSSIPEDRQHRLIESMRGIQQILEKKPADKSYLLRLHQPGDMGWLVYRHGVLYAREYGYNEQFEAMVAEIVAKFIQNFDPKRERCWIAEKDGAIVGSIVLAKSTKEIAKLRLLLVEPSARGLGIGNRLVAECVRFAKQAGYKRITLYTHKNLHSAIHLYKKAGFKLIKEIPEPGFGPDLIAQNWDLKL
jgi:DNA-binding MarR family transcriptional regulator/ribosomal protein S18 acetylase RimI-like enzyme